MKTLGVTGGIGSGKTTVCGILESLGARVFYADEEARRLMSEDSSVRKAISAAFGEQSYDEDGNLDREHLAAQIFGSDTQVRRINTIVHPKVHREFERVGKEASSDGIPLLVEEAALIFESGADHHLDAVAVVDAPLAERLQRVEARDGVPEDEVRNRMRHQLPPEELRRRADFVIENDGSIEDLRLQTEALYYHLVKE